MAIQEQMEMFKNSDEDVELLQEGGGVDTQSGNAVPLGGTQEGVRDDISANVSEGEMVIPAEVVRYHGVEAFMQMRDQAMMGYKKMEAMGQFGNPDEAKIPNDSMFNANGLPFSVVDLEYVDDEAGPMEEPSARYGGMPAFQTGGVVPTTTQGTVPTTSFLPHPQTTPVTATNQITGQPVTTGSTTFAPAPTANLTVPTSFTPTTLAGVNPTTTPLPVAGTTAPEGTPTLPSFGTVSAGTTSTNFFRNEAGEVVQIPVLNGRQTFEAPEGFVRFDPDKPEVPSEFPRLATPEADILAPEERKEEEIIDGMSGDEEGPDTGPPDAPGRGGLIDAIDAALGITSGPVGHAETAGMADAQADTDAAETAADAAAATASATQDAADIGVVGQDDADAAAAAAAAAAAEAEATASVTNAAADLGLDAGEGTGGDGRVICSELYTQGLLDKNLYVLDALHSDKYISDTTVRGYHFWAIPLVKKMRRSKTITNSVYPLALFRAKEIAHIMDKNNYPQGSFLGKLIRLLGEPVCYLIGIFTATSNYNSLYKKEEI